jgi:transcriptional regulator with XRE-family HTH domain
VSLRSEIGWRQLCKPELQPCAWSSNLSDLEKLRMKKSPNPIDRHVGSRVRMRRILVGMSQEKLGEALGLTFQQVQKYEKGTNRIGASRLQAIGSHLGVPVEYFFEGAPQLEALVGGFSETHDTSYVSDFLSTAEGVQLNKAFTRIKDAKIRRKLVELMSAIAGDEDEAGDDLSLLTPAGVLPLLLDDRPDEEPEEPEEPEDPIDGSLAPARLASDEMAQDEVAPVGVAQDGVAPAGVAQHGLAPNERAEG